MANEREVPEDIKEDFLRSYNDALSVFKHVNTTQADQDKVRKNLEVGSLSSYKAFASLAKYVTDDGNNVPVIMAAIESKNLAQDVFTKVAAGMLAGNGPELIVGELAAMLLRSSVGPNNMLMWEKFQQEQIEAMASDKV